MQRMKLQNIIIFLTISTSIFAKSPFIKGDYTSIDINPESVCYIEMQEGFGGSPWSCSGTMISDNLLISAHHCFNKGHEYIEVECGKNRELKRSVEVIELKDPFSDLALIKLKPIEENKISTMKIANQTVHQQITKKPEDFECGYFGFGYDNNDNRGIYHGVLVDELFADYTEIGEWRTHVFYEQRMKKIMATKDKIPNISTLLQEKYDRGVYMPRPSSMTLNLVSNEERIAAGILLIDLDMWKVKFDEETRAIETKENAANYFITTQSFSNLTHHSSGFAAGDSGGTLACRKKQNTNWFLMGVVSHTTNIWKEVQLRIMRPMGRSSRRMKIDDTGHASPLIFENLEWIKTESEKLNESISFATE